MKNLFNKALIFTLLFTVLGLQLFAHPGHDHGHDHAHIDGVIYDFPDSVSLELKLENSDSQLRKYEFVGRVNCLVGDLKQIEVTFESSNDLVLANKVEIIEKLSAGETKEFRFSALKHLARFSKDGSYVRLKIKYWPDYKTILAEINEATHPEKELREKLINLIKTRQASGFFMIKEQTYNLDSASTTKK